MAEITFSDDPDNPLNKKISELIDDVNEHGWLGLEAKITETCCEIYEMGFNDGQAHVYRMRQMVFVDDPENPGKQKGVFPGDPDYPKLDEFVTTIIT